MKKVIVIGAGLGGISAAISLAAKGYRVSIFEKNDKIGGKLNYLEREGFRFDLGPSIFTLPHLFEALFERAGKKMEDYFQLENVDPQWRNFFEDGPHIDIFQNKAKMRTELEGISPDAYDEFESFLDYGLKQYHLVENGYFEKGLDTTFSFIKHYGFLKLATKMDIWNTMSGSIDKHFKDPKLKTIFEFYIKYVGSSATQAPGFMNLLSAMQFKYGLWYVKGGMYSMARGFERLLKELDVHIHLNAEIDRIRVDRKKVTGIQTKDGQTHDADYIVSNMEVVPTYKHLLNEETRFLQRFDKFEPTCSGLVIHLGLKKVYPQLAHHNFFYSKDQNNHFDTVFRDKKLPQDPTIYLVAPTRTDPSQAPDGCDNLKILPHIPYIQEGNHITEGEYQALKEKILDKLERMGLEDLRKNVIFEEFWTPHDIERMYRSNRGSIYGVVSDWKRNRALKHSKQCKKYRNLFFAGGSTNPGGGMPMVVLSGQNVCDQLVSQDRKL